MAAGRGIAPRPAAVLSDFSVKGRDLRLLFLPSGADGHQCQCAAADKQRCGHAAHGEAVAGIGALHTVDLHGEAVILLMEDDPQRLVAGTPYLHIVHDTQTDGRQDGVLVGDLLRGGGIQIILAAAGAVPVLDVAVSGGSGVDLGHAAQAVVVIGCQITEALSAVTTPWNRPALMV